MRALKAVVQNGRLIVDEPTELPDGEVVYLHPIELSVGEDDELDEAERAALLRALDEGIAAQRRGDHVDAEDLVRQLLGRQ